MLPSDVRPLAHRSSSRADWPRLAARVNVERYDVDLPFDRNTLEAWRAGKLTLSCSTPPAGPKYLNWPALRTEAARLRAAVRRWFAQWHWPRIAVLALNAVIWVAAIWSVIILVTIAYG